MNPVDRITEVQQKHRWASVGGGDYRPGAYRCQGCGKLSNMLSDHEAHVAYRILEALQLIHVPWDCDTYIRPNPTQLWECWKTPWTLVKEP